MKLQLMLQSVTMMMLLIRGAAFASLHLAVSHLLHIRDMCARIHTHTLQNNKILRSLQEELL